MKKFKRIILYFIAVLILVYLLLLIPDAKEKSTAIETGKKSFAWNRDAQWLQMEELFKQARQMDTVKTDSFIAANKVVAENELNLLLAKKALNGISSDKKPK